MKYYLLPLLAIAIIPIVSKAQATDIPSDAPTATSSVQPSTDNISSITFPIAELGNCTSKSDCKDYCSLADHVKECIAFGQAHGLISKTQVSLAQEIAKKGGPGGCKSEKECRAFCDDASNLSTCIAFGKKHNLISPKEAKIAQIISTKGGPGGCTDKESCVNFCSQPGNGHECRAFAEDNGLINHQDSQKLEKLDKTSGPLGCSGAADCKQTCSKPENFNACIQFAKEQGFISDTQAQLITQRRQKMQEIEKQQQDDQLQQEQGQEGNSEDTKPSQDSNNDFPRRSTDMKHQMPPQEQGMNQKPGILRQIFNRIDKQPPFPNDKESEDNGTPRQNGQFQNFQGTFPGNNFRQFGRPINQNDQNKSINQVPPSPSDQQPTDNTQPSRDTTTNQAPPPPAPNPPSSPTSFLSTNSFIGQVTGLILDQFKLFIH